MTINLRTKLFLLLVIIVIFFFMIQIRSVINDYQHVIVSELRSSQEYAEALSAGFMNYFNSLWNLGAYINNVIVSDGKVYLEGIDRILRASLTFDQTIWAITWVDPEGEVIAATRPELLQLNIKDRDYFQWIKGGKEKVVSNVVQGRITGSDTIVVSRGVYSSDELVGMISFIIHIKNFKLILPVQRGGKLGVFGLVDPNGSVVYQSGGDLVTSKKIGSNSPTHLALKGQAVQFSGYKGLISDNRMGAAVPVPMIHWAVFSSASSKEILACYLRKAWVDISILFVILLCAVVGATYLVNHILKPVKKIRLAANGISQGDLSVRTGVRGVDEFGQTGQVFDEMAERIQLLEVNRNRFLQAAAHELRNPMAGIKGIVSLVRRRAELGKPMSEIAPFFQTLEREVDRMAELLNHILDAFRSQRELTSPSVNLTKVNMSDVIESALNPFTMAGHIHYFTYEHLDGKEVYVYADFDRLEDVIRNLLSNAVKYSPDGGAIKVKLYKDGENAIICVEDHGIGISEDNLKGVFECFYRVQNTKHNDPGGMGLGLYICKSIVEKQKGKIWVESQESVGSKFFISLPLYKDS